jgi:hypothetical protein
VCPICPLEADAAQAVFVPGTGVGEILAALRWAAEQNFAEAYAFYGEWRARLIGPMDHATIAERPLIA